MDWVVRSGRGWGSKILKIMPSSFMNGPFSGDDHAHPAPPAVHAGIMV